MQKKVLALTDMENQKSETVTQQKQETVTRQKTLCELNKERNCLNITIVKRKN